jgi:CHAD domain-containing protein
VPRSLKTDPDPATRLLRERMRRLSRHLPRALAGDEEEIHQMRVAARRLRVALPLLARKPDGKRVRRALKLLRDVTRAGGGSRDLDVSLALFDEAAKGPQDPALRVLRRSLQAARNRSRKRMAEDLLDLEIAELRRHLSAILARRAEGVFTVLVRLREGAEVERKELFGGLERLGTRFEPADLHKIRIGCRRLRYTAEVMDALRGQDSGAPALFRELQEGLGRMHDAWVLSIWLGRAVERAGARGAAATAAEGQRLQALFLDRSREHHAAVLTLDPPALLGRAFAAMVRARPAA